MKMERERIKNARMRGEENNCFSLNALSLVSEQQTVSASDDIWRRNRILHLMFKGFFNGKNERDESLH